MNKIILVALTFISLQANCSDALKPKISTEDIIAVYEQRSANAISYAGHLPGARMIRATYFYHGPTAGTTVCKLISNLHQYIEPGYLDIEPESSDLDPVFFAILKDKYLSQNKK